MNTAELKSKLNTAGDYLKNELAQIRTGRVTPSLLDSVKVDAYGTLLSVREVGTINVVDAQTLQVAPWDKNLLGSLQKGISNSGLNLNPVINGDILIVPIPSLTEERRKEFTRLVAEKVEEVKQTIRNHRQDAMKDIDAAFEKKEFGEDEKFSKKEEVEKIIKEYVDQVDDIGEKKKSDLMTI